MSFPLQLYMVCFSSARLENSRRKENPTNKVLNDFTYVHKLIIFLETRQSDCGSKCVNMMWIAHRVYLNSRTACDKPSVSDSA